MSFYKYYPNRKDWRSPYKDSRSFDATCCNHRSCSYCKENRTFNDTKYRSKTERDLKNFLKEGEWYSIQ